MFTSKEETLEFTATFETSISGLREDTDLYENVDSNNEVSFTAANHTTGGSKVYRMNQSNPSGPGIMLRVYPGDTVEPSVYAYHENSSGYGTSSTSLAAMITAIAGAFGGVNGSGGESQAIYDTFNDALGVLGLGGNRGDDTPAAYLNYIFFDETDGFSETTQDDDSGWIPVPSGAYYDTALVKFGSPIIIEKPGYIYIYLSYENESNNYVYFDDLKVTYTKSQVVQSNNYYAFGLQTKDSWTRMDTKPNQYLYNAGSELNEATSSYDMMFRSYDPAIGRMSGVDPMVDKYASMTPYNYSMNDPIYYNDPSGAEYEWASMGGCGCWRDKGPQDGGGQSNGMYGSDSGMYGSGWNAATYGGGFVKYGPGDGGALHDHVNFILAGSHAARERRLNIQTGTAGLINNAWDATSDDSFAAYNIASGRLNQIFSADFSKFDGKLFSTPVILAGPGNLKSVQNVVTDIKSGQSLDQQLAIFFLYMINPSYGPEFLINDVLNWPDVEDMSWLPDAVNFARRVASWGHADQYFGDHDELRHSVGTFLVAERHGALWAKNITNANEYYGLARFDIPNLGERLSGNQPWAFEFRDFYYNNVGLVLWYTYSSYKMLK